MSACRTSRRSRLSLVAIPLGRMQAAKERSVSRDFEFQANFIPRAMRKNPPSLDSEDLFSASHSIRQECIGMKMLNLNKLRSDVEDLLRCNGTRSACFLAAKLVTLSKQDPWDVYLLARSYYAAEQPLLAVDVIEKHGLLLNTTEPKYLHFALLAVQSWSKALKYDEVIKTADLVFDFEVEGLADFKDRCIERWGSDNLMLLALLCIERGKAYEAQDNRKKLIFWASACLHLDVRCTEALDRIVSVHLSSKSEHELLASLLRSGAFDNAEVSWLKHLYECSLSRFDGPVASASRFSEVENICAYPGGPTLKIDSDILALKAEARFNQRDPKGAFEITRRIFASEPRNNVRGALVLVAAMVELGRTTELFYFAHKQVKDYPRQGLSWYAVGAYYYSAKKFDTSRRYFAKATALETSLMPAWLALAHAHAMHDESDRAMAIYRTTARLFPGSHFSLIGTAMEYLRTNNVALAESFCQQAIGLCDSDPLVYNELGVVYYRMKKYRNAVECFENALQRCFGLIEKLTSLSYENILFNLGYAQRRAGHLNQAINSYKLALSRAPRSASGHAALGLVYHLNNQPDLAVECYHVSLGIRPTESLVNELMDMALKDLSLIMDVV